MLTILQNIMSCTARRSRSERMRQLAVVLAAALVMNHTAPFFSIMAQASVEGADNYAATSSGWTASPSDTGEDDGDGDNDGNEYNDENNDSGENNGSGENSGTETSVATPGNMPAPAARKPMLMSVDAGETIHLEAEKFYYKTIESGEAADLQPPNENPQDKGITIPLKDISGFTKGKYLIRIRYCGNGQTLTVEAGSSSIQIDCDYPGINFVFTDDSEMESLDVMDLSATDTLILKSTTDGKYGWVDWIELEPTDEKRIRLQAKNFVIPSNKLAGDDKCANMDPSGNGEPAVKLEMTLDDRFEAGQYSLLLTGTGNDRTYEVSVNGVRADGYTTTGAEFSVDQIHDDGWQGSYSLRAGDKVTILAPEGSYGWLKDVVWRWESGPTGGFTENGGVYTFEAENYYYKATADGNGADLDTGDTLTIKLGEVENFKAGTYSVSVRYAGDGQKLTAETGNATSEFFVPTKAYDLNEAVTAEGLELVTLSADDTLTLKLGGKRGLIDYIRLTPNESRRKRLTPQECSATNLTGNQKYANMDPGDTLTVTLDDSFDRGTYRLLLTGTGSDRSYSIQINGETAAEPGAALTYQTTGADFSDDQIHDDGWQDIGELNKGDTIKIAAPENEQKWGWIQDIVLEWDPAESGAGMQGDAYVFEAEAYYNQLTGDGLGADLQPDTELKIYLSDAQNFKAGNYLVSVVFAGNGQIMPMMVGSSRTEMIFSPANFSWEGMTAESMEVFFLDGSEVLTLRASAGKYTWIDKVLLVPTDENRIRLNVADPIVQADAVTGDNGNCANMDPGTSVTMTLDDRFGAGQYELLLFHAGFARTYTVLVNRVETDSYQAAGKGIDGFGTDQLLSNGWQGYYELKPGDTVTIKAPSSDAGWIKDIVWQGTAPKFYQKDEATGIIVEAEEGAVPADAKLSVRALGKVGQDYFSDENMRAAGYRIELTHNGHLLDLTAEGMEEAVQVTIPLPAGFDKDSEYLDLFYQDGGSWESLFAGSTADGSGLTAYMQGCGVYAVSMEKGVYHYEAENYYSAWADDGSAANFETGNGASITIPLEKQDGFDRGIYNLLVNYCGGGSSSLTVKIDGKWAGAVPVAYTGDDSWGSYRLTPAEGVLELYSSNVLELAAPKNQYHWIDYVRLVEAEPFTETVEGVNVEAAAGSLPMGSHLAVEDALEGDPYLEELHDRFHLGNITARYIYFYWDDDTESRISPATAVKVRMALPSGMDEEESYCLYYLSGSGQGIRCTKIPSTIENGELVFSITKETGLFALVEGAAILPAGFDSEEIYGRTGARVAANAERAATDEEVKAAGAGKNKSVKTRTEGSHYYYEGEAYYKAQFDSLTGDLQPGSQMQIRLSDNRDFRSGKYTLTVRSNGNRQKLIVKVNNQIVGNILRAETSFDMVSMTEDTMVGTLTLSPSDLLTIEGETGGNYGWVDYVELTCVSASSGSHSTGKTVTYKGADHYERKAEGYEAADLQPGDVLSFRAGDHESFVEGAYQIAVTSNGNRTRLWVKVNGQMVGSIVRAAGSGFEKTDFTTDVMHHTLNLRADDVISLEAPGNEEEGPYGWIEKIQLIPAPAPTGEQKAEYRYDGEDFYQASLYSPAADLQPGESIVFPVSNDPDFTEGNYRLSLLSNGTRERFDLSVNGIPVGIIRRKATGYSDVDYSQDYLDMLLTLKPGDVLTVTGQDGDFYGWVNYILLERAKR